MDAARVAARGAGLAVLALTLVLSCGGRSGLGTASHTRAPSACPEPPSAVPDPGTLMIPSVATPTTYQLALHNRCDQTIWPAWGRTGGLDQSAADPAIWAPIEAGESNVVTMYYVVIAEVAFWGRTRCSFDDQGNGSCETGDCDGFVCKHSSFEPPSDATIYDFESGFGYGYNVAMTVATEGCEAHECRYDLGACAPGRRTEGACGVAACRGICPSASSCCHEYSNGCFQGATVEITFCP